MNITIGLLIPLLGTTLGAAFVFFMKKDMSARLQKSRLGGGAFSRLVDTNSSLYALVCRRRNVLRRH